MLVEVVNLLDVGTGSGILAIYAAKRGCRDIRGVDNDSLAVQLVSTSHNKQVLIGSRSPALKFLSPAVVTSSAKLPSLRLLAVLT